MYGIDLDEYLDDSEGIPRFGWLLDRILDLPDPKSRFRQAMSDDDEMADLLIDLEESRDRDTDSETKARLRYSDLGVTEMFLLSIDGTLKATRAEAPVLAGRAKKVQYPEPQWAMPETAVQRRKRVREKQAADRLAQLFGVSIEDL